MMTTGERTSNFGEGCLTHANILMGDERHVVFEYPHLQSTRDKYAGLFSVSTMVQFLWQDDLVSVS